MFVISFNICLFIYFSVKYAIQSNDCDVFVNKQSIYLSKLKNIINVNLTYKSIYPFIVCCFDFITHSFFFSFFS